MKSKVLFKLKSLFIKIEIQESRFLKCIPTIHTSSLIPKQVSFNLLLKLVNGYQIIYVYYFNKHIYLQFNELIMI